MYITADISLYPLHPEYEPIILEFIEHLHTFPEVEVHTNSMSTHLTGTYAAVLEAFSASMEKFFHHSETMVVVAKFVNLDRREETAS